MSTSVTTSRVGRSASRVAKQQPPSNRPGPDHSPRVSIWRRRWSRHLGLAVVVLIGAGASPLLPFSTRANNAAALKESEARLAVVERNNDQLRAQREALLSDAEVRRLAREEFGLAPTGSEVLALPNLRGESASRDRGQSVPVPYADTEITPPQRSRMNRFVDFVVFWD